MESGAGGPRAGPRDGNHLPLQIAAMKGDWMAANEIIGNDNTMLTAGITDNAETVLHIATASRHVSFVKKLVDKMITGHVQLGTQNTNGANALCFAAATGIKRIAEVMVNEDPILPRRTEGCCAPLYLAVLQGHSDMAYYLYDFSDFPSWRIDHQRTLVNACISSGLCGLALKLLQESNGLATECQRFAVDPDANEDTRTALELLAEKPSAFESASQQALWRRVANSFCWKDAQNENKGHELFSHLWNSIQQEENLVTSNITGYTQRLLFSAAKAGNVEFLAELLSSRPELLLKFYENGKSIFHIAVDNRDVKIFNLIYEVGCTDLITSMSEEDGDRNNMLHLAAKLPLQNKLEVVPGAALQMQRELLWFKAVEELVPPSCRDMKNGRGKTPCELFTKEHEPLRKAGEKWMTNIAKSCMLIATIIATVGFTVGSSVKLPKSPDTKGLPHSFWRFTVSEAIALFSSSTSVLLFLSILVSRYAFHDFTKSLPLQLLMAMLTLLLSVASMMVSFCICFVVQNDLGFAWDLILLGLSGGVTIMIICLTSPLLKAILLSTSCSWFLFKSQMRLFVRN